MLLFHDVLLMLAQYTTYQAAILHLLLKLVRCLCHTS
jgi:hypothetical protein